MRWVPWPPTCRLTPDLEVFLQWLAATPYGWDIQADGRIRAEDHGAVLCAVTAVARHREALAFSVGDWVRAGESLGLSYASAGLIVDAADGRTTSRRLKLLRARLLLAARITPAPASPTIGRTRVPASGGFITLGCVPDRRLARHARPRRRSGRDPHTAAPSASRG